MYLTDQPLQANVLICNGHRAQIADFGLAIVGDATIGRMSTRRSEHGTTRWMSPERLLGKSTRLGSNDDAYAFGGLMYMVSRTINANRSGINWHDRCSPINCRGMVCRTQPSVYKFYREPFLGQETTAAVTV
jgi:serine/threonine protein kinase